MESLEALLHLRDEFFLEGLEVLIEPRPDQPLHLAVQQDVKAPFLHEDFFLFFLEGLKLLLELVEGAGQGLPFKLEVEASLGEDSQQIVRYGKQKNLAFFLDQEGVQDLGKSRQVAALEELFGTLQLSLQSQLGRNRIDRNIEACCFPYGRFR